MTSRSLSLGTQEGEGGVVTLTIGVPFIMFLNDPFDNE